MSKNKIYLVISNYIEMQKPFLMKESEKGSALKEELLLKG